MADPRPVTGLLEDTQIIATASSIVEWQLPSGMIPWFPGGHADPWNHVEAAMAVASAGFTTEAERAYDWLVGLQHESGCLLYTSPSPRDRQKSRMPSSA